MTSTSILETSGSTSSSGPRQLSPENINITSSRMWLMKPLRPFCRAGSRVYGSFFDTLDQLTGIEKRELLAHLAGECDPFRILSIPRGPGTCDRPNLIPSAFNKRLLACVCYPETNHLEYMWLHLGEPKRCGCGYWFELCPIAPL